MEELSRRSFLKGAALAGAGVAGVVGAGALVACAPGTSPDGSDGAGGGEPVVDSSLAISPAGANYPWSAEPPEIAEADIEETIEVDVAVVGLGVSGCAALAAAAEEGVKVIGIEKAAQPCQRSSQYAYLNGPHSDAWGLIKMTPEQVDEMIVNEVREMSYMPKMDLWLRWARESPEVFEWYCKNVPGFNFPETAADFPAMSMGPADPNAEPEPPSLMFQPSNKTLADLEEERIDYPFNLFLTDHQAVLDGNVETAKANGADVRFGHFAEALIKEGDRVVGLYVRNADNGKYIRINASRGVILTTGDYFSNTDMVRFFCPQLIEAGNGNCWPNMDVEGNRTNTGDGYKLGYWVGAQICNWHAPMTHIMGGPALSDSQDESMGAFGSAPYMRINANGARFMKEDVSIVENEFSTDCIPNHKYLMLFDDTYPERMQFAGMMGPVTPETLQPYIDKGHVFKGETLDDLFAKCKSEGWLDDVDAAKATVVRYNEVVASGYDSDFMKDPKYLAPIEKGPFYAQLTGVALCLVVLGGLESDKEAHVYDRDHRIIPGLYAGGNIQGSRFHTKYPFKIPGTSHCMAMFYGYVAGKNAVAGK
jgi:succinate dehydrogenase/fumarate reductase flavoprotein subunit